MYMTDLTSDDFAEKRKNTDLVVIPVGSLEAHGHHLPLGTDIFAPRLFCRNLEEKIGKRIFIAPEIPYGQSYDLSVYPGTIHVPSQVMAEYVCSVGKGMLDNGLKKILLLNGHGGNTVALDLAIEKLAAAGASVLRINWWQDYAKDIRAITGEQGHAGKDETSAMLYYDAKLVEMEKAAYNPYHPKLNIRYKGRAAYLLKNAMTGDARAATAEQGRKIFEKVTEDILEAVDILESGEYYTE